MHRATRRFWTCFADLPDSTQELARKNFTLLERNPRHPSLHFKKVGKFGSVLPTGRSPYKTEIVSSGCGLARMTNTTE